jgi:hypothetical protein
MAEAALGVAAVRQDAEPAEQPGDQPPAGTEALVHDLNNVFAPILMAASLLKEKVTDEKGMRMLTVLEENAQRGAEIVRRLRDSAQGDGGRGTPPRKAPRSRRGQ